MSRVRPCYTVSYREQPIHRCGYQRYRYRFSFGAAGVADTDTYTAIMVSSYLEAPVQPRDADPLLFWSENVKQWPELAKVSRKYFSAPPTSVESERLYSIGDSICSEICNRLASVKVEKLLFLRTNLKVIEFEY